MSRYTERDTELEVDVTCIMSYRGEPIGAIVTMPNGLRYSLPADRVDIYFALCPNQHIVLEAIMGGGPYDRSEPLRGVPQPRVVETATDEDARLLRQQAWDLVKLLDEERANVERLLHRRDELHARVRALEAELAATPVCQPVEVP